MKKEDIWRGLQATAKSALSARDYRAPALAKRLAGVGVEAGQIVSANRRSLAAVWIPGVEVSRAPFTCRGIGDCSENSPGATREFWRI
jgi:hypothetical protein